MIFPRKKTERVGFADERWILGAVSMLLVFLLAMPVAAQKVPSQRFPALTEEAAAAEAATVASAPRAKAFGGNWFPQGPSPVAFGQVENVVPNDEVSGAVNTVAAHPTDPNVVYIGAVNGGIWKTTNATAAQPHWVSQTDTEASNSIGALEFDPTDGNHRTLVAGHGNFSSFSRIGGVRNGLLYTTNGGNNWNAIDGGGTLVGKNISGVAPRGDIITVSVNTADTFSFPNIGIWRSVDGGASFVQIAVGSGAATGLPGGVTYDLVGDPNNLDRLFTSVTFANLVGGQNGIYRSDDTGATWTKVSDAQIDALLISGVTSMVEFSVGQHNNVYAAVANSGRLAGLFRSGDGGDTWTSLDLPATVEGGGFVFGLHPGGQASIHLSIVADPVNASIVYVGGDRQPFFTERGGPGPFFPNSIGANNFSGRLFRVDGSQPAGSQAVHLTHTSIASAAAGGTASNSSPHADSREMTFAADGSLIETDDGGVYRRTNPTSNTGDWFSMNGDLQITEHHDSSYDSVSNTMQAGNQDNGSIYQNAADSALWLLLLSGDGGDTAVDDSDPNVSIRFSSSQFLGNFNRTFWDANNNFLAFDFPARTILGGGSPLVSQFSTPIELNAVDPNRMIIGGANSVYESFDQAATLTEAGPGIPVNGTGRDPIGYGAGGNADALYIGSGDMIFVRLGPPPAPLVESLTFPGKGLGSSVRDIVLNPDDANAAYVITTVSAFQTLDAGATWTDITANLVPQSATPLRSLEYIPRKGGTSGASNDALVVGSNSGAFVAFEQTGFAVWGPIGTNLPTVPVFDLDYDAADDVLTAGTLGRGSFKLRNLSNIP